jgi:hypothetical protein
MNEWQAAIDHEMVMCEIGVAEGNAKECLAKIIDWHVSVALDPKVSKEARELVYQGYNSNVQYQEANDTLSYDAKRLADTVQLARRCLWIAFCWNDHNFGLRADEYARSEAKACGINTFEEANAWLINNSLYPTVPNRDKA